MNSKPGLTQKECGEIRALEVKATKAPWDFQHNDCKHAEDACMEIVDAEGNKICDTLNADGQEIHRESDGDEYGSWCNYFEDGVRARDMELAARSRNLLPRLLDSLERAMRLLEGTLEHQRDCGVTFPLRVLPGGEIVYDEKGCDCGWAERQAEVANWKGMK